MSEKYQARSNNEEPREKTQDEINSENNANSLKNAAEVAIASGHPIAVGIGTGVKVLDNITGGKATQELGKVMTQVTKQTPEGKQLQKASNFLSESGAGDKIGQAASIIGGAKGGTPNTASNVTNATTNVGNQASNLSKSGNTLNTNTQDVNQSFPDISSSSLDTKSSTNTNLSKKSNFDKNFLGSGNIISKKLKIKIILGCGVVFFFIILIFAIIAALDFGNLDLTNKSKSMGGYVSGSMNTVTPGSISEISGDSIDGKGGTILSNGNSLSSLLGEDGLNSLNQSIASSASSAGYGTGAAPAAAAQALISNLQANGIIIPYFWGGGHGNISMGANGNWGNYEYVGAGGHSTSFSNQPLGLDCSGFVSWALYNGGCKNFSPITARNFKNLGPSISFSQAKTGDIAASDSHVVLILENRGDTLLCAEAKGSAYGVIFTSRSESALANYKIVDMSEYYQQNCS